MTEHEHRAQLAISLCKRWEDLLSRPDRAKRIMRISTMRLEAMDRTFESILEADISDESDDERPKDRSGD